MKLKMEVYAIADCGDDVKVSLQGDNEGAGKFAPILYWTVRVPPHIGRRYRLGQKLRITVS